MIKSTDEVKTYLVIIPAHEFLYIKNYEINGDGIFGKNKILFQDKTMKRFVV